MEISLETIKSNARAMVAKMQSSTIVVKVLESKKKYSKIIMITSGLLLLLTFVLPLWNIQLEAPQYPTPLGMNIYINRIADEAPHDVKNINLLNHYVGMKEIPEHMPEFDVFPKVIIVMSLLGIIFGLIGHHKLFIGWLILMSILGIAGLYDFYLWEYDYGHDLDPKAILKFTDKEGNPMGFQPPVFGSKHILNFVAHSYPGLGAFAVFFSMALSYVAFSLGLAGSKEEK